MADRQQRQPALQRSVRSRLIYRMHAYRRRKDEKAFTWTDYRDLMIMAHRQLDAPIVLIWDNLNRHTCAEMRQFIAGSADWLRVIQMPAYAPDLNPAEMGWSQRSLRGAVRS